MNAYTETHTVLFIKPAKRSLRDKVIEDNFTSLLASVNNRGLAVKGWLVETNANAVPSWHVQCDTDDDDYNYEYRAMITVTNKNDAGKAPGKYEFPGIVRSMFNRSSQPAYGSWKLAEVDGQPYTPPADDAETTAALTDALIGYSDVTVPDEYEDNFGHLFGLDAHIARIKMAILAGGASDWRNRFHVALIGPPGCGKSDICQTLKRTLGDDAVMEYDATATTGAGAIKDLAERDILPRVLIVEEIEKADPNALSFLLGVMDLRGEIRKTTHRQSIQRDTKLLVIATVNNVPLFENIASGALASRFSNKVHFKRPSRDMLSMILTREVSKIDGDVRWIGPTLDYCDDHEITDPRQVIALCLCGMDGWLTGEYAKMLAETAEQA